MKYIACTTLRKTYFLPTVFDDNMNPKTKSIRTQGSMDAQSIIQIAIDYGNFLCSECSIS